MGENKSLCDASYEWNGTVVTNSDRPYYRREEWRLRKLLPVPSEELVWLLIWHNRLRPLGVWEATTGEVADATTIRGFTGRSSQRQWWANSSSQTLIHSDTGSHVTFLTMTHTACNHYVIKWYLLNFHAGIHVLCRYISRYIIQFTMQVQSMDLITI